MGVLRLCLSKVLMTLVTVISGTISVCAVLIMVYAVKQGVFQFWTIPQLLGEIMHYHHLKIKTEFSFFSYKRTKLP